MENVYFDQEQLLHLLNSLYTLTGIRANIFDAGGKGICVNRDYTPFCARINSCPEGRARCEKCEAGSVLTERQIEAPYYYRCHAGLCEAILPILSAGRPLAYLAIGQFLDDAPLEEQWDRAAAGLDWFPGGAEGLRESFLALRQLTPKELEAYTDIIAALSSYIQTKRMILTTEQTDLQRLELFLEEHYMEKLSLETISEQLHIGRTRLCALAKQLSNGATLSQILTRRRIRAAKELLLSGDVPIAAVAEGVGISDYNYFTKVFRSATGMTPSAFRKKYRYSDEIPQ